MNRFSITISRYRRRFSLAMTVALAVSASSGWAQHKPVFLLRSGDRVVLVGDTLIEREQTYGYLEQRLTVRFPEANVTFRNLGWSADTPAGESRASFDFDKPGRGFELLKEEIAAVQPSVVIVGYGMASSFKGMDGLTDFKAQYNKLLDAIQDICTNKPVRFVLLSPIRHENLGAPLPDPAEHNIQLALYSSAIDEIATERKATFISLFHNLLGDGTKTHPPRAFTDDGIHLTAYGYVRLAEAVEKRFIWEPNIWRLEIDAHGQVTPGSCGTKVSELNESKDHVRFTALDEQLVSPFLRDKNGRIPSADAPSLLQVDGLKSGTYELKVDGVIVATAAAKEWKQGVAIDRGPQFDQAEQLRQAIFKKNQLYFDRWRPQNETYLFGFRKHEQGQNAKEIPMFDPLIKEQEARIAKLRQPVPHTFELVAGKTPPKPIVSGKPANPNPPLPIPKSDQPLPDFEVAPGFEVSLYAESPLLAKPIQMNFDPRGRLWVVSSSIYPQIQPGQEADDKVLILEDTKGTGKVDKSTVFADGLLIPTGVEPGDGGVYVGQSTELLHFKDTTGSGKADERRVILSGFGTEDTHHIVHTLHWGPDGQLYFDQSIYIHSHIETPHGVERLNSGGIWHLRPPTMEMGVFLRGFCNPWGHQFDDFGQSFVTDGAGGQGISFGIPGATYFTYAGMRRELKSVSPGSYPKFCALEIIHSRQFPDDWQGNAITCDFRAHRVVRFAIDEKDSAYATREMPDLLRSTNVTFRPIDLKLGPDGALYIADWANPVIQHGEVDFRDPRRDHEHGRIWRVTAKGRPLLKKPILVTASNRELFDELVSPNLYNQQQARRVLTERGKAIQPDLAKWAKSQTNEKALLEALWMYQAIDVVEPTLLEKLLNAHDGHIRAAATRVVSYWHPRLRDAMALLTQRIADDFPRVRIEAMRALAEIPSARSAELVLGALNKPMDPFLDYAAWLSINDLARPWVAAVQSGQWKSDGREAQLEFGLKAIEPSLAAVVLGQVLQNRTIPADGSGPWIELIGQGGGEKELRRLFDQLAVDGFDANARTRVLTALMDAQRLRNVRPSGDLAGVAASFKGSSVKARQAALKLAGAWKLPALVPRILTIAGDTNTPAPVRKAAFESLREIGGPEAIAALQPLTGQSNEMTIRHEAVLALTALDLEQAKQPILDALADLKSENDALEFWRALLGIKGVAPMVAKALPKSGLAPVMAKAGLRVAREAGREEPELIVALTRGADLEAEGLGLTDAEMKQIAVKAAHDGDPARGELIFRRREIGCVICHAIGGVGGKVGPDLTSTGASAPIDYLIESVFYPNRKIKEGYHSTMIETKDGAEFAGILVREDQTQVVLRDTTDKEISIPVNNITSRKLGNSLMPAGLVDTLTSAQQLDLFRFLSELGKPGPYDASRGNVARSWKLLPQNMDGAQFEDAKFANGNTADPAWQPAATLVDGRLLKQELQGVMKTTGGKTTKAIFASARVQVSGGEALELQCRGIPAKAALWIDGNPAAAGPVAGSFAPVKLAAGVHSIMVKLDTTALPEFIQLQCSGGTFLTN
jgi:putative heme-binding domain-containing protein